MPTPQAGQYASIIPPINLGIPEGPNMKHFPFFLDAWNFCRMHELPIERIKRLHWKTWGVDTRKPKNG